MEQSTSQHQLQQENDASQHSHQESTSQWSLLLNKTFQFTKELITNQIHIFIYYAFLLIQNVQIIGYLNNSNVAMSSVGLKYWAYVTKYLNLHDIMKDNGGGTVILTHMLVPIFFGISMAHMILLVISFRAYHQRIKDRARISIEERNFHKNKLQYVVHLGVFSYTTILTIPIFQISIVTLICVGSSSNSFTPNQSCYTGYHILLMAMSIVNLMYLLIVNIYFSLYYYHRNPFHMNFLSSSSNIWNLGKLLVKIGPMCYLLYDIQLSFIYILYAGVSVLYVLHLAFFKVLFTTYKYNHTIEQNTLFIQITTCFICVLYIPNLIYATQPPKKDNIMFLFSIPISIITSLILLKLSSFQKNKKIRKLHSVQKYQLDEVFQYIIYMIYQLQCVELKQKNHYKMMQILLLHRNVCVAEHPNKKQQIHSQSYIRSQSRKKSDGFARQQGQQPKKNSQDDILIDEDCYCQHFLKNIYPHKEYYKDPIYFYKMLICIINRILSHNKKAYSFYILKAYILYYKLNSEITATTTISLIMKEKLDFSSKMLVNGLLFELNEQYLDTRDMETYRRFSECLLKQQHLSHKISELYHEYWSEILDEKSSIAKLFKLSLHIYAGKLKLQEIVEEALKIFPNHIKVLELHKNMLKYCIRDYHAYTRYHEEYKLGLKLNQLTIVDAQNTIQFRANEDLLMINLTKSNDTSEIDGGYEIISVSSNVIHFLGYRNKELVNKNLNMLIPKILRFAHDHYLDRTLNQNDKQIKSKQIRIYPLNKKGNIVQCNIMSKFMPNITCGINIVSFLELCERVEDEFCLIYHRETGLVDSMTDETEIVLKSNMSDKKNLKKNLLDMPDHIHDLLPNWDYRKECIRTDARRTLREINSFKEKTGEDLKLKEIRVDRSIGPKSCMKVLKFSGNFYLTMYRFQYGEFGSLVPSQSIADLIAESKNTNTQMVQLSQQNNQNFNSDQENQPSPRNSRHSGLFIEGNEIANNDLKLSRSAERKPKRTIISSMINPNKSNQQQKIVIEQTLNKKMLWGYLIIQIILIIIICSLISVMIVDIQNSVSEYQNDTDLISDVFIIETRFTNMNYLISISIYIQISPAVAGLVDLGAEIEELSENLEVALNAIKILDNNLITKSQNGEIPINNLSINLTFFINNNTSLVKTETITQSCLQVTTYITALYNRAIANESLILFKKYNQFWFLQKNLYLGLPLQLESLALLIKNNLQNNLQNSSKLVIKILAIAFAAVLLTIVLKIMFVWVIYNKIQLIFQIYECVKIKEVKKYLQNVQKYQIKYGYERANGEQSEKNGLEALNSVKVNLEQIVQSIENNDEDQVLMDNKEKIKEDYRNKELNFEDVPSKRSKLLLILLAVLFIIAIFGSFYYYQAVLTQNLVDQANSFYQYPNLKNLMFRSRQLSLEIMNLNNFWTDSEVLMLYNISEQYFKEVQDAVWVNSQNLDILSEKVVSKVQQMKFITKTFLDSSYRSNEEFIGISIDLLESMDDFFVDLNTKTSIQVQNSSNVASVIQNYYKIFLIGFIVCIVAYFFLIILKFYLNLIEIYIISYEMYKFLGKKLQDQGRKRVAQKSQ